MVVTPTPKVDTDFTEEEVATKHKRLGVYISVDPKGRFMVRTNSQLIGHYRSIDNALSLTRKTLTGRATAASDGLGPVAGKAASIADEL